MKRFKCTDTGMWPAEDGAWVVYEEFATALARAEAAETRLVAAEALLRETFDRWDTDEEGKIGTELAKRILAFLTTSD